MQKAVGAQSLSQISRVELELRCTKHIPARFRERGPSGAKVCGHSAPSHVNDEEMLMRAGIGVSGGAGSGLNRSGLAPHAAQVCHRHRSKL